MYDVNLEVAKAIIAAQDGSDFAKGNAALPLSKRQTRHTRNRRNGGYKCKVNYIILALNLIRKNQTDFSYYIERKEDQNGFPSIIVYFEIKIEGKRIQVSFHTPLNKAGELEKLVSTGRRTRWNKRQGACQGACEELMDYFGIH